jgi:hypothetical protein
MTKEAGAAPRRSRLCHSVIIPGSEEQMNLPQQKQKAPETAGGFTCTFTKPADVVIPLERPR